ncbi:protein Asg7p [Monosporozyma servazzii]
MDGTYEHGKERYLIAPFQDGSKQYRCECKSCQLSFKNHNILQRLFWFGLFIPFALLYEMGLYIYIDIYLNHRILQPNLTEQDYPTEYERKIYLERHEVKLEMKSSQDESEIEDIGNTLFEESNNHNNKSSNLDLFRYEFMKTVATDIVDSHDYYRSHFLKWTLRCLGALIGQVVIIVIVVVLCTSNS